MRTVHFISGLPRSGSTLLCNLLAQNPRFHVAGTSPLIDMLLLIRANWDRSPEAKAMYGEDCQAAKWRVMHGMIRGYYSQEGIAFDKSRSWLAHLEMAENLLARKVKVLVPVRDIRDILASFEMLWRRNAGMRQIPLEAANYFAFQNVAGRCGVLMSPDGWVGIAVNRIRDAIQRGFGDRLYFVQYERLTYLPRETLGGIYDFLGEPWCDRHEPNNVQPVTYEDDAAYGFPGLHTTRTKVEPTPSRWRETLGEDVGNFYAPLNQLLSLAGAGPAQPGASP
jgi:sulfotransferase